MNYKETIDYLFNAAPLFQMKGAGAYKEGLFNTRALDEHLLSPHRSYKTIHVAGTNGKGSTCHTLASILQCAGYKVGLYTSPHLQDFRERIRVNGEMIPKSEVIRYVEDNRAFFEPLHPSFFELATNMAFDYFKRQKVDVAVIEVGLGGRLDCTNIINPDLSIITNISFDHVQFLGDTLEKIAREKAGIIKEGVPVVIGETQEETAPVFQETARRIGTSLCFADQQEDLLPEGLEFELKGIYQVKNLKTIIQSIRLLQMKGYDISEEDIREGCATVMERTGLRGRWQVLRNDPLVVCDAGHNIGGIQYVACQLRELLKKGKNLRIVFGMVNDKDISGVLSLMPKEARYYFTKASVERALKEDLLKEKAQGFQLEGDAYPSVHDALLHALVDAGAEDVVFIGGSCFIVADLMQALEDHPGILQ